MGPFSKVWTQTYTDSCDVEVEYQNVTVEECKQICENKFRCNVLVLINTIKKSGQKYMSCNVRKCPVPIPPPSINPNPNHNASFYLAGKQFNFIHFRGKISFLILKSWFFNSFFE